MPRYRRIARTRLASTIAAAIASAGDPTLQSLGERIGCSERSLRRIVAGDVIPQVGTVARIARALELDVEQLLDSRASAERTRQRRLARNRDLAAGDGAVTNGVTHPELTVAARTLARDLRQAQLAATRRTSEARAFMERAHSRIEKRSRYAAPRADVDADATAAAGRP